MGKIHSPPTRADVADDPVAFPSLSYFFQREILSSFSKTVKRGL